MLRKNQKEEMPFAYYLAKYAGLDPAEVTARLGGDVTFDGEAFGLSFLGRPYRLAWPDYAIESPDAAALALRKMTAQTFLLRYLERGQQIPFGGAWLNFRQLPWGEVYVKTFSGRCLGRAAGVFGNALPAFSDACRALGGAPIPGADAGFELPVIGPYRIRILLWAGDDEFPASAQILYSDQFTCGFTAEDSVVAAELLLDSLCGQLPRK